MVLATHLERVFIIEDKEGEIRLPDPNPKWDEKTVLNYYANIYPILTTAKIAPYQIENDTVVYRFQSVMGTKG